MKLKTQSQIAAAIILSLIFFISCDESSVEPRFPNDEIVEVVNELYLEAQQHDANVPGIFVGLWNNKNNDSLVRTWGYANPETEEELTREHSFKIASITKTMVCTVIAQLIDEGKLDYEDKLADWFPDLKEADNITIRMLGDMTSGYADYLVDEFEEKFDNVPNFTATPMELIDEGLAMDMFYTPGTGFNYSNTNTVLLGLIIEKITGNALEDELKSRIFDPLNMVKTGAPAEGTFLPEPAAQSYHPDTRENWTYKMDYSPEYACGNAYSVYDDLKVYIEALASGSLESPETFEKRFETSNRIEGTVFHKYHFGIIEYRGFLGHSGNTDYYTSEAYYNPEKEIGLIIFSNTSTSGFTTLMFQRILAEVLKD